MDNQDFPPSANDFQSRFYGTTSGFLLGFFGHTTRLSNHSVTTNKYAHTCIVYPLSVQVKASNDACIAFQEQRVAIEL